MRVANYTNLTADVPFTLSVARYSAFTNILFTANYVAKADCSHIVRGRFSLPAHPGSPVTSLYCRLLVGEQKLPKRVVRMVAI